MVTDRWDDGNYPWGYYQFHHHFIAHDAGRAGVTMRLINVGIAIVLIGAIGALMPSAMRRGYVLAILAAWTPMGIYFIASTNPSSWAFTGVFAFAAGLWSATQSYGWRRWSLLGAAALGAVLSCTSRGDSAFFLFVHHRRPRVRGALASRTLARGHACHRCLDHSASSSCARRTSRAPT